jgi:hypothetical protein
VLRPGVLGPAGKLGGADQLAILDEHGVVAVCRGHGGTR